MWGRASPRSDVPSRLETSGVTPLPAAMRHALHVGTLPDHHRDPFDRLLVVQAQLEGFTLMTADSRLRGYDVELLSVVGE